MSVWPVLEASRSTGKFTAGAAAGWTEGKYWPPRKEARDNVTERKRIIVNTFLVLISNNSSLEILFLNPSYILLICLWNLL